MVKGMQIIILFILSCSAIAQQSYKQLHEGDVIPSGLKFKAVKNYPTQDLELDSFKGKYIILDFWTKNCSSCVAAMPKMQKLQNKFERDLQVLLITTNSLEELSTLFSKSEILKQSKLPMIFGDTILTKKLFPYWSVPHHVWIDKDGKIVSINDGSFANDKFVSKLISNGRFSLPSSDDHTDCSVIFDKNISLASINEGLFRTKLRYYYTEFGTGLFGNDVNARNKSYSAFFNRIDNCKHIRYDNIVYMKDSTGNNIGVQLINFPIDILFMFAYSYNPDPQHLISGKILVGNNNGFGPLQGNTMDDLRLWRYFSSVCYETIFPGFSENKLKERLKSDLKRFLGIEARVEERIMECWVVKKMNDNYLNNISRSNRQTYVDMSKIEDKALFSNQPIDRIVSEIQISNALGIYENPLIVNETNLSEALRLNIELPISSFTNFDFLNKELYQYGFSLKKEFRPYKVLAIINREL